MKTIADKRTEFRRYEDRRSSLMLSIHETLFENAAGNARDSGVVLCVNNNFQADRTALLTLPESNTGRLRLDAAAGDWPEPEENEILEGIGIEVLLGLQRDAFGALALMRSKRPTVFQTDAWSDLWNRALKGRVAALLSVSIAPRNAPKGLLMIMQSSYSREWSSRDRELIEEVASLLARVRDKDSVSNRSFETRN